MKMKWQHSPPLATIRRALRRFRLRRFLLNCAKRLPVVFKSRAAILACLLVLLTFPLLRLAGSWFALASASARLDDDVVAAMIQPGIHIPKDPKLREKLARAVDNRTSLSINLWRHVDSNCSPEVNAPPEALYGTGTEQCFSIGLPDAAVGAGKPAGGDPATFWQMNSRAFCYMRQPTCLSGARMDQMLSFEARGSATCQVLSVRKGTLHDARSVGLNESCAAFRKRHVANMFGQEVFRNRDQFFSEMKRKQEELDGSVNARQAHGKTPRHSVKWVSEFAIVIPKYPWSYNICHFNRLWNYAMWMVRNLKVFMGDDADAVKRVDVLFRSRGAYNMLWHKGMRAATVEAVQRETGIEITVGHMRKDANVDVQCLRRSVWLGREGRIDSFPFFNDSDVWLPSQQVDDSHWPVIPHDALWLRQVVAQHYGLAAVGNFSATATSQIGTFHSIPVPPRRIAVLQRSAKSNRRLTPNGQAWFDALLLKLSEQYQMQVVRVRVSGSTPFKEQAAQMQNVGLSLGLHGANIVNTMFQPAGGALFEIFPWRYVRYYYAAGANSGLRYSYHEPIAGSDPNCTAVSVYCAFRYREAVVYLTEIDRWRVRARLHHALQYIASLHQRYPDGMIPLRRDGSIYRFGHVNDSP